MVQLKALTVLWQSQKSKISYSFQFLYDPPNIWGMEEGIFPFQTVDFDGKKLYNRVFSLTIISSDHCTPQFRIQEPQHHSRDREVQREQM